tara:strand:+ start:469 stop:600 length:132 start_codon:yes stop_codon:yes gene_type:complete
MKSQKLASRGSILAIGKARSLPESLVDFHNGVKQGLGVMKLGA